MKVFKFLAELRNRSKISIVGVFLVHFTASAGPNFSGGVEGVCFSGATSSVGAGSAVLSALCLLVLICMILVGSRKR